MGTETDRHTSPERPLVVAEVNRQFVITKCDYFVEVQVWPLHQVLDPGRWLSNFRDCEGDLAVHLLNSFMYFRQPLIDQLFSAAFQTLSRQFITTDGTLLSLQEAWRSFVDDVIITRVTGEIPHDTDSSFHFARMARQILGIRERQIMSPETVVKELYSHGPRPVVFVDDFVGSGRQFISTWRREVVLSDSSQMSFAKLASVMRTNAFFYCPLICTEYGAERIRANCSPVMVNPAHCLSTRYNVFAPDSVIWPEAMQESGPEFVEEASRRAGIPPEDARGFHRLGLALAFEHSVPDATLPLFYWKKNGWQPLVERR